MVIPNSNGYTLFSIDTSDISPYASKLLYQNRARKFNYLFDRLITVCPDLKEMVGYIKQVSESWYLKFRGRTITFILRVFTIYSANPQHYGYFGDFVMASNYSKLKHYFQKIVKTLITTHEVIPNRYYGFQIPRDKLIKISKLFGNDMLPLVNDKIVPQYLELKDV